MSRRYELAQQHGSGRGHTSRHKVTVKVCMLDDSVVKFEIEPKAKGQLLFDLVYDHLNLEECEYFGLSFYDRHDNLFWLDPLKHIKKQVNGALGKVLFRFSVKFYTPDPALIQEEYTRYLFALQIKRDLLNGKLKCSESTSALLASYIVQGELGDYDSAGHSDYLSDYRFFPNQTPEAEARIAEFHKQHRGLSPGDADYNLLDVARRLEMYGITLYPAEDKDGVPLNLAAANMGLLVFQNDAKINTFSWAKIRKLSFKRRRFLIKLHPEIFGHYKDVVEFQMSCRDACKSFWKMSLSTHAFFRQTIAKPIQKQGPRLFSRGSSFRYSGRTQKQIIENCRESFRAQPSFQRTQSLKVSVRNASSSSNPPLPTKAYTGYGNVETRVVEATPPVAPIPLVATTQPVAPMLPEAPTPPATPEMLEPEVKNEVNEPEEHQEVPNGPVVNVEAPRMIPLKDLDEEPDMMRDESEESQPDSAAELEWQPEPVNLGQKKTNIEVEVPQESKEPKQESPEPEEPKKFDVGSPLNVYSIENDDKTADEFVVPPGVVRVHLEPQPKPMSPIEVDEASTTSSPPPPPPESEEVSVISNDSEKLPSPPPELVLSPVTSPESLPSPPPELVEEQVEEKSCDKTVNDDEELPPPPPEEKKSEVTSHNGFHDESSGHHKERHEIHIECRSVATVPNGGVKRNSSKVSSRGSRTSQQSTDTDTSSAQDNVFEEPTSPFRSDLEMSPPVSPTTPTSFKNIEAIAKAVGGAAFNMARELLDTERTYVKDLEVITIAFRDIVSGEDVLPETVRSLLFSTIDPIYDFHCAFLEELEKHMQLWNNPSNQFNKFGDLLLRNMKQVKRYVHHLKRHDEVMLELERATRNSKTFETAYKEFELQKVCYLPFNAFLLKPAQRLMHYKFLLERLLRFYPQDHVDRADTKAALDEIVEAEKGVEETMKKLENFQKIIELQRDLIGVENLVQPGREFVREGCLQKLCRKGPQPRMFFLFSDILLYTCKGVTLTNQFRVRGQLPLSKIELDDQGPELHGLYPFVVTLGSREFVLAAHSTEEKYKWMEDLNTAIGKARQKATCNKCGCIPSALAYRTPKMRSTHYICEQCYSKLDEALTNGDVLHPESERICKLLPLPTPVTITRNVGDDGSDEEMSTTTPVSTLDKRHAHCHTMSTRRVCWHRNTSVSMTEHAQSVRNQMSGELLRKFKSGNRWQKLWVVFTNFCLFFYKSHEDDYPLASLPLIGYTVSRPSPADNIDKELVFKLQYKTHVYYFRAESEYSFLRWMEVIASATESSSRTRIFSRQESAAT